MHLFQHGDLGLVQGAPFIHPTLESAYLAFLIAARMLLAQPAKERFRFQLWRSRQHGLHLRPMRADPFGAHWSQVEAMLAATPELEAKALFGWLCEQHPSSYQEGQVRTFQRRVNEWRALHQPQVAVLEQVHRPGEVMQTDGVWLTELAVTIQGQPLAHLFIHCVLPYSNWEWGCLAQSESLMALHT